MQHGWLRSILKSLVFFLNETEMLVLGQRSSGSDVGPNSPRLVHEVTKVERLFPDSKSCLLLACRFVGTKPSMPRRDLRLCLDFHLNPHYETPTHSVLFQSEVEVLVPGARSSGGVVGPGGPRLVHEDTEVEHLFPCWVKPAPRGLGTRARRNNRGRSPTPESDSRPLQ